jgi:hypothetical protein
MGDRSRLKSRGSKGKGGMSKVENTIFYQF